MVGIKMVLARNVLLWLKIQIWGMNFIVFSFLTQKVTPFKGFISFEYIPFVI